MRKTYVYDPISKEMVEKGYAAVERGILVVSDLPDFVSPVDRKVVRGRAGLREHDRRHGTTNIADFKETWAKAEAQRSAARSVGVPDPRRTEAAVRAFNDLAQGRVRRQDG